MFRKLHLFALIAYAMILGAQTYVHAGVDYALAGGPVAEAWLDQAGADNDIHPDGEGDPADQLIFDHELIPAHAAAVRAASAAALHMKTPTTSAAGSLDLTDAPERPPRISHA